MSAKPVSHSLTSAGVDARIRIYPELGHVGILTAIARPCCGKALVLDDIAQFAAEVSKPREMKGYVNPAETA